MKTMFDLNGVKQVNKKKVTGKAAALATKKKQVHAEVLEVPTQVASKKLTLLTKRGWVS